MMTGMIAVCLYFLHIIIGSILWKEYDNLKQPISDLTASGSPNRNLLLIFTNVYGFMAIVFALSFTILESRKHNRLVLWGGILFVILHCISLSYAFFPEDLPNHAMTFSGTMHIIVTALIVPFTILTPILIGLGYMKEQVWKRFGYKSIITGLLILVFGGTTALFFAFKWPYFGLIERINICTLQSWTFYFSFRLTFVK